MYSIKGRLHFPKEPDSIVEIMLDSFRQMSSQDVLKYIRKPFMHEVVGPYKNSRLVYERYLYDITMQKETRLMILLAHMYIERCVEKIVEESMKNFDAIGSFRFSQKLLVLEAIDVLEGDLLADIKLLNKLRNDFAHRLTFDVLNMPLKTMSDFRPLKIPQLFTNIDEKIEYNHYLISLWLFALIHKLVIKFDFLEAETMP